MVQKLARVFIGAVFILSLSFHVSAKVRGEAVVTTIKSEVLNESRELLNLTLKMKNIFMRVTVDSLLRMAVVFVLSVMLKARADRLRRL